MFGSFFAITGLIHEVQRLTARWGCRSPKDLEQMAKVRLGGRRPRETGESSGPPR